MSDTSSRDKVTADELLAVVNMQAAELSILRAIVLQLLHDSPASARAIVAHLVVSRDHPRPLPLPSEIEAMQARAVTALAAGYREMLIADPAVYAALGRIEGELGIRPARDEMRGRLRVVPSSDQTKD